MILLHLLLTYKAITKIDSKTVFTKISNFGFEANASISLTFSNIKTKNILYALFSEEEYAYRPNNKFPAAMICEQTENFPKFILNLTNLKDRIHYDGYISESGIYTQGIINCNDPEIEQIHTQLTIKQFFVNPSTHFDLRWNGIIKTKKIIVTIYMSLLLIWIIFYIYKFKLKHAFHHCMTISFISATLYQIVLLMEFQKLEITDDNSQLTILRIILGVFNMGLASTIITLSAKGWCIIRSNLPVLDVVLAQIYSLVFISNITIMQNVNLGTFELTMFMFSCLAFVLYLREIIFSINDTSLQITAHLLAISNAGIDPESTPIYRQKYMYISLHVLVIFFTIVMLLKFIINIFVSISFWTDELVNDIMKILSYISYGVIFWPGIKYVGEYAVISNPEGIYDEMSLAEIETISSNSIHHGGVKWHEGMPLPSPPHLVQTQDIVGIDDQAEPEDIITVEEAKSDDIVE